MSRWFPEAAVVRIGDAARPGRPGEVDRAGPSVDAADPAPPAHPPASTTEPTRVDALAAAFEREVDARGLKRGARITCIVAGDAARYRIVPWRAELDRPAQRQVLAQHCFVEAYGEAARTWVVRRQRARHGASTLAAALDAALLDRLQAAARARGFVLASVQPSLMTAFNEAPGLPRSARFWFASVEQVWTTALLIAADEALHVKQLPSAAGELGPLLDREAFALGLDGPRCAVHTHRWQAA